MSRVFIIGPGDHGSIPGQVIPKTQKLVLDTVLLNTQHYKAWINAHPYTSVLYLLKKEAFGSLSTKIINLLTQFKCQKEFSLKQFCLVNMGVHRGVMVKAMDCAVVINEFELQSRYYVHFRTITLGKGMSSFIHAAMG